MIASELVTRALRRIGVVAHNNPATADQLSTGIDTLNSMLLSYKAMSADLEHVELGLRDTVALPSQYDLFLIHCLAAELAPQYSVAAPDADRARRLIQAHYTEVENAELGITDLAKSSDWIDFYNA